jgi:predicted kinase
MKYKDGFDGSAALCIEPCEEKPTTAANDDRSSFKMIFTVGVSGSGKTTWANQFCKSEWFVNVNRDDIRRSLFNFGKWSEYKFTKERERKVSEEQLKMIEYAFRSGFPGVVISDTNLSKDRCLALVDKVSELLGVKVESEFKVFDIDPIQCMKYDLMRDYPVGSKVIMEQYKRFSEEWLLPENRQLDNGNMPNAIIIDVDGTIAKKTDARGHFEWSKVGLDEPRTHVINLIESVIERGYIPIVMSGRDSACKNETMEWLDFYLPAFREACNTFGHTEPLLFMRKEGDMRSDVIVKAELFEENIRGKFYVEMAFDDRPGICCLWRYKFGIDVINVSDSPFLIF